MNNQTFQKVAATLGVTIGDEAVTIAKLQAENNQLKQIIAEFNEKKKVKKDEYTSPDPTNK